jgi:hypothetical protein
MNRLDHLLWATPDLEQSMIDWKELSGVRPARGGEHAGMGTRNALVSLNDGVYFEIIGPDPAQSLAGTLGGEFSAYEAPRLYTFAVQSGEFERAAVRLAGVGAALATPITLRRDASGTELEWRIAMIEHHSFGPLVPFLIDWGTLPILLQPRRRVEHYFRLKCSRLRRMSCERSTTRLKLIFLVSEGSLVWWPACRHPPGGFGSAPPELNPGAAFSCDMRRKKNEVVAPSCALGLVTCRDCCALVVVAWRINASVSL